MVARLHWATILLDVDPILGYSYSGMIEPVTISYRNLMTD